MILKPFLLCDFAKENLKQQKIKRIMQEYKAGILPMGRTGKPVQSRKQAIAIALAQSRKEK